MKTTGLASALAVSALLWGSGCSVDVSGIPCTTDDECPTGEFCNAGTCGPTDESPSCPETACEVGVDTACGTDGTVVTCAEDADGCGTFADTGGAACAVPLTCQGEAGAAACACPALGSGPGAGCQTLDATACEGDVVLRCVQMGTCQVWSRSTDCTTLALNCGGTPAKCQCAENTSTTFYVDPVSGSPLDGDVAPSGVQSPAVCRFSRLTDAAGVVQSGGKLVVQGYPSYPTWEGSTTYQVGDLVIPATPLGDNKAGNDHVYRATTAGTSAATEPAQWPRLTGDTVQDGSVIWEEFGPDWTPLDEETFPLNIPAGVTLTSDACPASGNTTDTCDPTQYAVLMGAENGGESADVALTAGAGTVLQGISVAMADGKPGATGVECSSGKVSLEGVIVLGNTGKGSAMGRGIDARNACELTGVVVGAWAVDGPGISLRSSGPAQVAVGFVGTFADAPPEYGNKVGVEITGSGNVDLGWLLIGNSVEQGIRIDVPDATQVNIAANTLTDNGVVMGDPAASSSGIHVVRGTVALLGNKVEGSGRSGIRVDQGTVTIGDFVDKGPDPEVTYITQLLDNGVSADTETNIAAGLEVRGTPATSMVTAQSVLASGNLGAGVLNLGGTLSVAGLNSQKNLVGVASSNAGVLTVTAARVADNPGGGVLVYGGAVTFSGKSLFVSNGRDVKPAPGLYVQEGSLTLQGTATDTIVVTGSGSFGVLTQGGSFNASFTEISSGLEPGVGMLGGTMVITDSQVAKNTLNGIISTRPPNNTNPQRLTVNRTVIADNGGYGLHVLGGANPVLHFEDNDVTGNASSLSGATMPPAGVRFQGAYSHQLFDPNSFNGNRFHANRGDQLRFEATGTYNLQGIACTWTAAKRNHVYCYNGGVGVYAENGAIVDAQNLGWATTTPTAGVDYKEVNGGKVTATACYAVSCP